MGYDGNGERASLPARDMPCIRHQRTQDSPTQHDAESGMKRIMLINPPDVDSSLFDYETAKRGRANNYPAYGLGVLARHLINHNFDVRILNLNHELLKVVHESTEPIQYDLTWQSILLDEIDDFRPDLVGVTC